MLKRVCNVCGKDFDMWDEQEEFGLHYCVGYGSKYDGETINVDLCCECFDKLMDSYIIPKSMIPPFDGCDGTGE